MSSGQTTLSQSVFVHAPSVASTATRIAWMGPAGTPPPANPTPLAQKRLSVLVSFQPWSSSITAKVEALTDPNRGGLDFAF